VAVTVATAATAETAATVATAATTMMRVGEEGRLWKRVSTRRVAHNFQSATIAPRSQPRELTPHRLGSGLQSMVGGPGESADSFEACRTVPSSCGAAESQDGRRQPKVCGIAAETGDTTSVDGCLRRRRCRVLESKWDPIRKKLVRRLLEEHDKVLCSFFAQKGGSLV
jgi:hypothetical protein